MQLKIRENFRGKIPTRAAAVGLFAVAVAAGLSLSAVRPAAAAALLAGEYACAGSGGTILIGLGFKVLGNGTYTDLDGKSSGRLSYGAGGSVSFIGGHLSGQVGHNLRNGGRNFEIHTISCSHN